MSSIYVLEPMTKGKVVLATTLGDIDIELWAKEAPKACRNFVQLCQEGYYDNTIFHRIVKNFIVQGGDPTGTGSGGESIYEKPFADEFHSRLRFNHRGIVAMASTGQNTNQSQFFISLDRCDTLDKKHTIFGKITGDTIFNVLKVNDFEVDENERPLFPPKILSAEIIYNPFDDIVPRPKKVSLPVAAPKEAASKPIKNLSLLSFEEEQDEDNESSTAVAEAPKPKMKNALCFSKNAKVRDLAAEQEREKQEQREALLLLRQKKQDSAESSTTGSLDTVGEMDKSGARSLDKKLRERIRRLQALNEDGSDEEAKSKDDKSSKGDDSDSDRSRSPSSSRDQSEDEDERERQSKVKKRGTLHLKKIKKKKKVEGENGETKNEKQIKEEQEIQEQDQRERMFARLRKRKADSQRESKILEKLSSFKKNLKHTMSEYRNDVKPEEVPEPPKLTLTSTSFLDGIDPEDNNPKWMSHRLQFQKLPQTIDPMARNEDDHYEVYDPLKDPTLVHNNKLLKRDVTNKHDRHMMRLGQKKLEEW